MMRDHGHETIPFTVHNQEIDENRKLQTAKNVIWNSNVYEELSQLAKRTRPDVVHFTNTFPVISPAAYWAFQSHGIPVLQSLHNFRLICPGSLLLRDGKFCNKCVAKSIAWPSVIHRCYRNSATASAVSTFNNSFHKAIRTWDTKIDKYIALSEFSKQQFIQGGISPEKLIVKPNFVLKPPSLPKTKSDFVVFVGRLSTEKGIERLIEAWNLARIKFKLLIIGSGPLEEFVRAAEANSNGMIEYLGQLPHEVTMKILADAQIAVVPSISVETFGRAVIEAYSVATPVIGFDIGSIAENIEHGATGWLVENGNASKLCQQIEASLSDKNQLKSLGAQARRFFESRFSVEKNYEATIKIYQEVIDAKRTPHWYFEKRFEESDEFEKVVGLPKKPDQADSDIPKKRQPKSIWPDKVELFGLKVSVTDYGRAVEAIKQAAKNGEAASISCHAAHAVVTFTDRPDWTEQLNLFEMITPDGQPVRWAMNLLHNAGLIDRVYGPELMLRVCDMAAQERLTVFLFGGSPNTLELLCKSIEKRFPDLTIAGAISPPYRELTDTENSALVEQINSSKANILFVGLGCPKQDLFVSRNRSRLSPVQICVGAAFDFHAGVKKIAPRWMQRNGLEWLFRLAAEPRRLFKRYLVTNSVFVFRVAKQVFQMRKKGN